jgi:hypothetical protein
VRLETERDTYKDMYREIKDQIVNKHHEKNI